MNLERLSAPMTSPDDELREADLRADFFIQLDEHIAQNKKLDDEDAMLRARELVLQRQKERSEAAVRATLEAEKKALSGGAPAAAAISETG